jgi:CxxC motif-containing protein (DUF1111 family)
MRNRTLLLFTFLMICAPASFAQRRPSSPPPPPARSGDPLAGLTATQSAAFVAGRTEFTAVENIDDGLGPVFNDRSCVACHSAPAIGGSSPRTVTRFGTTTNGAFDPLANLGGSLIQERAIGPREGSPHRFNPEIVPAAATIVTRRRTPPLYGLGFVDATPDSVFNALAQDSIARHDGTAGRVNLVDNIQAGMKTAGKFGWKAQVPSLAQFAGDAYLNEMGITNPLFPNENCPQGNCAELSFNPKPALNDTGDGIVELANYMIMLGAPQRGASSPDASAGEQTFNAIGCASCHTATLQSGRSQIAALDRKTYHPYSDFLLHDMGSLGDGIEQGNATGREIRTAPLWGLRDEPTLLHDGRARTIDDAVLAHAGQGQASRDRYANLTPDARAKLQAFLKSL